MQHPSFSAYRLRYSGVGAGAGLSGCVLWNRQTEFLRIYSIYNYPEPGILDITDMTFRAVNEVHLLSILNPRKADGTFRKVNFLDFKKFNQFTDSSRHLRFSAKR